MGVRRRRGVIMVSSLTGLMFAIAGGLVLGSIGIVIVGLGLTFLVALVAAIGRGLSSSSPPAGGGSGLGSSKPSRTWPSTSEAELPRSPSPGSIIPFVIGSSVRSRGDA